jgi:hyperosmotically inducible periplasmic protein
MDGGTIMMTLARILRGAGLVGALTLLAAPAFAAQPEDVWITTKVKMALLTDDSVDGLAVNVDTVDGHVTLHGRVDSGVEKAKAETLTRQVAGVTNVRNLLAVTPAGATEAEEQAAEVSDETLTEHVKTVLERDEALSDSNIEVKSVNGGNVVLAGEAKTLTAHYRAMADARAVPGVRRVASEIRSPDELGDQEIWDSGEQAGTAGAARGAASDAWITTKVKLRLMGESGISPLGVNVDTRAGVVTLFGSVSTAELKTRAGTQAQAVAGVKGVENELQVVPDVAAPQVRAKDEEVVAAVRERLAAREALADANIDVAAENGVVRLTGTVATQRDRLTALTLARSTDGVTSVIDGLELKQPGG